MNFGGIACIVTRPWRIPVGNLPSVVLFSHQTYVAVPYIWLWEQQERIFYGEVSLLLQDKEDCDIGNQL